MSTCVGLSSAQAADSLAARSQGPKARGSRSYAEIVRTNTFTLFNLVLGALFVLTLTLGDPNDALSADTDQPSRIHGPAC